MQPGASMKDLPVHVARRPEQSGLEGVVRTPFVRLHLLLCAPVTFGGANNELATALLFIVSGTRPVI